MPRTKKDMSSPIVVGVGLEAETAAILHTASALAASRGVPLIVVHALDFHSMLPPAREGVNPLQQAVDNAKSELADLISRHVSRQVECDMRVLIYVAHKAILDAVEDTKAGLIVLGPNRSTGFADLVLGSTADYIIRSAEVPTLIVRSEMNLPIKRALVAFDFDDSSRRSLREAIEWVGAEPGGSVDVIHVNERVRGALTTEYLDDGTGERLQKELQTALRDASPASDVDAQCRLVWSDSVSSSIIEEAANADLIVLGTHGENNFVTRALIGSVASSVVRKAPGSVLMVPK